MGSDLGTVSNTGAFSETGVEDVSAVCGVVKETGCEPQQDTHYMTQPTNAEGIEGDNNPVNQTLQRQSKPGECLLALINIWWTKEEEVIQIVQ